MCDSAVGGKMLRRAVKSYGAGALLTLATLTLVTLTLVTVLTAQADTLTGALISAYQNNPQLNSQRAVVRQTDETVPQALSGYKPTVTATGQFAQEYTSTVSKVQGTATRPPDYPRTGFGYSPSSVNVTNTTIHERKNLFEIDEPPLVLRLSKHLLRPYRHSCCGR